MSTEISEKLYTVPEFLELDLPDDDEYEDYELVKGQIVGRPKGGTSAKHARIVTRLGHFLSSYLDNNPLGDVYTEGSCSLGRPEGSNWVKPDVCFVVKGRTAEDFDGPIPVAPDLVIEVHSPSDNLKLIQDKVDEYRDNGVRLVWSIYLLQKFVAVYKQDDPDTRLLNLSGVLEDEDVLPGFKLAVSKLFE